MTMERTYKLGEFAKLMNVSTKSLQRWDKNGLLVADRTDGCHRSYSQRHIDELNKIRAENSTALSRRKNYRYEDLTGKTFGKLMVLRRAEDWIGANGHRHICWLCKCECGNEVVIKGASLKAGYNKSCGCLQYGDNDTKHMWAEYLELKSEGEDALKHASKGKIGRPAGFKGGNNKFIDLTGMDFGFWHVIEKAETKKYKRGQVIYWKCRCKCGTIKSVPGRDLRSGASQSCGCMSKISWLEYFTKQYLAEHSFKHDYQKYYDDLLGTGGKPLVYDFVVYDGERPICIIECQGEQHYRPVRKFGGAKKFTQQQIHDSLKRNYARDVLKVPVFEVMYTCTTEQMVYDALDKFEINKLL